MHSLLHSLATAAPASGNSFWLPRQASTTAPNVDFVFMGITYVCYFFFALVVVLMVLFVVRYRQKGNQIVRHEGASEHNTPLEVTWTVIPVIIVVMIFFGGFKGYLHLATPPANAYQIDVVAKQWSWTFKYPNGAISDDLVVPAGRPVKLVMRSDDVLHSLYIPDFRVKKDVVPARYNVLWFQADEPTGKRADGSDDFHNLFCTEYCGKDHSRMLAKVKVIAADVDYRGPQTGKPAEVSLEDWGKQLYTKFGCNACHSVDGAKGVGPSFKGLYGKQESLASGGTVLVDENYIMESIYDPNAKLVAGFAGGMPTFKGQIDSEGIQSIIAFIKTLK